MRVSQVYNATLLQIIAKSKEITYSELKKEYCVPASSKVIFFVSGKATTNVWFSRTYRECDNR